MAGRIPYKQISKGTLIAAFIATIGVLGYLSVVEAFYPNRVKVSVLSIHDQQPVRGKKIIFRALDCSPQPCQPEVLAEGHTDFFGNIRLTTKQLTDSFEVVVDGFTDDGPWQKRPGSLFFTRSYADRDFYTANLAQTGLTLTLTPAQ